MAIEKNDRDIVLTGETARNFNYKMKNSDYDVIYKRNKFIDECRNRVKVEKLGNSITLNIN